MINLNYNIPQAGTNGTAGISNPSRLVENASYFETRVKALQFNGTSQYLRVPNFNPTKELGYSIITGFKIISFPNAEGRIFSKSDSGALNIEHTTRTSTSTQLRYVSTSSSSIALYDYDNDRKKEFGILASTSNSEGINGYLNGYLNDSTPIGLSVGFDEISNDLVIGAQKTSAIVQTAINGYIFYIAVFKGVLNSKEIIELSSNTLLKNPSIQLQNKYSLELLIDFNNPYDDAGTLKFPDLSPNAHDVIAEGWASLEDLQSSLIDINELRFNIPAGALLDETGEALYDENNTILEED